MKPPRPTGNPITPLIRKMKPRDWLDLVLGVLMLGVAFLGITGRLPLPWWGVLFLSLGYVLLVGGVMVRVRSR